MKIIAFYLPQYHRIKENDIWWGEGFTEWTNTRKAKPLFSGHHQPREPYNDYYYNLLDSAARQWQADIAKQYGISGFCYYHYWFRGKQLLETPLKLVLESGEPDFPFCLSWANMPWTRIWYAGADAEVLIEQKYGDEKDWAEHFSYLMQAFSDQRYIRIDNKPVFIIFRPEHIGALDEMLDYWNKLAIENGFEGIYFINTLTGFANIDSNGKFEADIEFEPGYTIKNDLPLFSNAGRLSRRLVRKALSALNLNTNMFLDRNNYDVIWRQILRRQPGKKKTFLGAFVDWDNTARRNKNGLILDGASPEKFQKYLSKQIYRAKHDYDCNYIFVNAWNEWAEGTYLEPDKKYGYAFLEAVRTALIENGEM
jgi:lipopolysaccharide biosynthesis protein